MFDDCGATAVRWNGTPTGHEAKLGDNAVYIVGTNTKAAVLFVHDVFGWKLTTIGC
ncbi:hypothetical protein BJ878DRAFT_196173 [Calycina marina]|uniref:Uncharacterized protein n=1 Tax=Calycina marina TaxID=1763456 RepID=A0A9P8CE52_9HELO|nr:hypothetical protein BJ878DRAFT_196173 [Calycina marina]